MSSVLYTIYFHPLSSYPGPWFMRGSRIPYTIYQLTGCTPFKVLEWHKKYGPVVRIAPDELAFSDPRAWKDMHGHRAAGEPEFPKVQRARKVLPEQPITVITAPREEHGRLRRQMAHGFSDRSLREQQPIIKRYIDMLVQSLYENCEAGSKAQDMVKCKPNTPTRVHLSMLLMVDTRLQGTTTPPSTLSVILPLGKLLGVWKWVTTILGFR